MTDYTPTTEEVRQNWQGYGYTRDSQLGRIKGEDFDRWLAEVKAEAWLEGARSVGEDEFPFREWDEVNPYRNGAEK